MQNRISWRGHYVSPEWLLHIFTVCVILLAAGVSPRLCSASVFGPGLSLAFSAFSLFPEPSLASFALFIFNRVAFSRFLLWLLLYFVCFLLRFCWFRLGFGLAYCLVFSLYFVFFGSRVLFLLISKSFFIPVSATLRRKFPFVLRFLSPSLYLTLQFSVCFFPPCFGDKV